MVAEHPGVVRVRNRLVELGATGEVHVLDEAARTAQQAADALGVQVAQIANSLVFEVEGTALLVLASGAQRVDTVLLAEQLGAAVHRATPEFVRAHTGFAIGGVAPVGHPEPIRTLVDTELARHEVVWAAAGHPHAVFPTSFDELVRITGGAPARLR